MGGTTCVARCSRCAFDRGKLAPFTWFAAVYGSARAVRVASGRGHDRFGSVTDVPSATRMPLAVLNLVLQHSTPLALASKMLAARAHFMSATLAKCDVDDRHPRFRC